MLFLLKEPLITLYLFPWGDIFIWKGKVSRKGGYQNNAVNKYFQNHFFSNAVSNLREVLKLMGETYVFLKNLGMQLPIVPLYWGP